MGKTIIVNANREVPLDLVTPIMDFFKQAIDAITFDDVADIVMKYEIWVNTLPEEMEISELYTLDAGVFTLSQISSIKFSATPGWDEYVNNMAKTWTAANDNATVH